MRFRVISKKHEGWLVAAWQDPAIGKKGESFFASLLGHIKYREERPFSLRRKPNAEDLPDQGSQAQTRADLPIPTVTHVSRSRARHKRVTGGVEFIEYSGRSYFAWRSQPIMRAKRLGATRVAFNRTARGLFRHNSPSPREISRHWTPSIEVADPTRLENNDRIAFLTNGGFSLLQLILDTPLGMNTMVTRLQQLSATIERQFRHQTSCCIRDFENHVVDALLGCQEFGHHPAHDRDRFRDAVTGLDSTPS
ncbi:hypothetical protein GR205_06240 [Rhizobium leguminosarum]|nr:hypothetical protein [Rhizobium ruizarguesonis]NEJ27578.1 hypothetical protein [Rhizobium ruizarguesonis]